MRPLPMAPPGPAGQEGGVEQTRSLCPVCLTTLPARLETEADGSVYIRRTCQEHGPFSGLVWKGEPGLAFWRRPKTAPRNVVRQTAAEKGCPHDCGRCPDHKQHACTVLLEITARCNLRCPVCFADSGGRANAPFTPLPVLLEQLAWIREQAGAVVLQLSGGEPTLYPDLAQLVRAGAALFPAVQLNTNGILLAERPALAQELAAAGLSWVFLQFDGTTDAIYRTLRGQPLLERKLAAVDHCRRAGLGVVLVPTVAAGVNDGDLGNLLRLAISLAPTVRGLHLQPMTVSGRNSLSGQGITLPEVLQAICAQSNGLMRPEHATPPGCEHERCSFHCRYRLDAGGGLIPLRQNGSCCPTPDNGPCCPTSDATAGADCCCGPAEDGASGVSRAIDTILRVWQDPAKPTADGAAGDAFSAFIAKARARTFSVTCMAFQDVWNVDLARLQGCCVHVYAPPARLIPFCAYNLTSANGTPLHRWRTNEHS